MKSWNKKFMVALTDKDAALLTEAVEIACPRAYELDSQNYYARQRNWVVRCFIMACIREVLRLRKFPVPLDVNFGPAESPATPKTKTTLIPDSNYRATTEIVEANPKTKLQPPHIELACSIAELLFVKQRSGKTVLFS